MKIAYTQEQIQIMLSNLDQITTIGIRSARAVALIAQTLDQGTREEDTGDTKHTQP